MLKDINLEYDTYKESDEKMNLDLMDDKAFFNRTNSRTNIARFPC